MTSTAPNTPVAARPRGRLRRFYFLLGMLVLLLAIGVWQWPWWLASGRVTAARHALWRGDFPAARRELAAAQKLQAGRADVPYLLAVTNRRLGDWEEFRRHLQEAEKAGWPAADIERQRWLATAQTGDVQPVEAQLQSAIERGVPNEAAEEIYEALAKGHLATFRLHEAWRALDFWLQWRPDAAEAHRLRADIYERQLRLPDAIDDYRAVVAMLPDDFPAHLKIGQLRLRLDQPQEARPHFETCVAAHADNVDALLGLAECESRLGDRAAAQQRLEAVLRRECMAPQRAGALAALGRMHLASGRVPEAIDSLTEAISLTPADNTIHYSLSRAYVAAGQPQRAEFHTARLRQIRAEYDRLSAVTTQVIDRPNDADLRFEAGTLLIGQGFTQEGLGWLRTALKCHPQHAPTLAYLEARRSFQAGLLAFTARDAQTLAAAAQAPVGGAAFAPHRALLQGMSLLLAARLREAIDQFGAARDHPETRNLAYTLSGEVLYKLQQYEDARRLLLIAINLDPQQTGAHRWLAATYHDLGAMDDALRHLRIVAQQAPQDPRPHRLMGLIHKDYELFAEAVAEYRESLRRAPGQPDAPQITCELAECLVKQRRHAEAWETLRQCPPSPAVATLQAECQHALGDRQAAQRLVAEALKAAPDDLDALQLSATLDLEAGRVDAAAATLQQAVAAHPKDWRLRYQLSRVHQRQGQTQLAEQDVQAMQELRQLWERFTDLHKQAIARPDDVETRYQLGLIARQLDRPDLAQTWFAAALGMDSKHAGARKALEDLASGSMRGVPPTSLPSAALDQR